MRDDPLLRHQLFGPLSTSVLPAETSQVREASMSEEMELRVERVARIIDPDAWRIADEGGRDGLEKAVDYSRERARAAIEALSRYPDNVQGDE